KGQPHLLAISRRQSLSEGVTDVLVVRGSRDVMLIIASNSRARFSDRGFGTLAKRCECDDELAEMVGSRPDIPRQHFLALLAQASQVVRQKLEEAGGHPPEAVEQSVSEAAAIIQQESAQASPEYQD